MSPRAAVCALALGVALSGCKRTEKQPAIEDGERSADTPGQNRTETRTEGDRPYPAIDPAKVTRLVIDAPDRDAVVLSRAGGRWRLNEPVSDAADARAVQFALEELRTIAWGDEIALGDGDWATLTVTHGGKVLPPLHLNRTKAARVGDSQVTREIHNISYFTFARELRFWRDRTLVRVEPIEVDELWIARGGKRTEIEAAKLEDGPAAPLFRRLLDLEADGVADGVSPAEAGLDDPRLVLTLKRKSGLTTLEIGKATGDGGAYARVAGSDRILVLAETTASAILDGAAASVSPSRRPR